jgi:hypothetical protein
VHVLASSKTYVYIPIDPPPGIDPTAYPVEAALIPDKGEEPAETDWHPASWIGGEAALLVGPGGGTVYPEGEYFAFARVTAGVEKPVLPSGRVRVGMP